MSKIVDVSVPEVNRAANPEAPATPALELAEAPRLFGGVRVRSRIRAGIKQKVAE